MDAQIFATLQRVQATQDEAAKAVLMEETASELGAHFARNIKDFEELAWDMYNIVWRDISNGYWSTPGATDLAGQLVEVKNVRLTETDYIEEDLRGLRAYFQGKGGQIRSDIIRAERLQMPREELVSAIDMHADDILTDFWGQLSKLQSQVAEKIRTAPVIELISLIQLAVQSGATYGEFAASTISSEQFDPILDRVLLKSAGNATIVGTMLALRKLSNIGLDFGFAVQQQIFQSGTIAHYKGVQAVALENYENFEGSFVLPNDEVWIIGKNSGRITYYGNQAKVQILQLPSFYRRWETARDVGISVYGAAKGRIGRVKLT
jgi:hypothetical protein